MHPHRTLLAILLLFVLSQCQNTTPNTPAENHYTMAKPYARYWWFASKIKQEDIKYNLNWLKAHGFGGVEVAFMYPSNAFDVKDSSYIPRYKWQSDELRKVIEYTLHYCDSIGMGCDLTFGTLWPFGDLQVSFAEATQRFGDSTWRQEIRKSWEHPHKAYVVDHLSPDHYTPYLKRMLDFFPRIHTQIPQAYFVDSWEVETKKLWCSDFAEEFIAANGYDIRPFMDSIYHPAYSDYLYDYMHLISNKVLRFYADFDLYLNKKKIISRGQVSGAPCDLISAYSLMDIPESEAMLFEPEFSTIPASAALLAGKKFVSAESFTCLYGWPSDYLREEQTADLKMVADALFSNGVNKIIWHGKAHNPAQHDTVAFYATVHLGKDGSIASELKEFNHYLETVSSVMQKGQSYSDIAVYLPTEDAWKAGVMPQDKQFKWAWGHYEMRYVYFPEELNGYNPSWINGYYLNQAVVEDGLLKVGNLRFKALYVDVEYLDYTVLKRLKILAENGACIIMKQTPQEPGINKHKDYTTLAQNLPLDKQLPASIHPFIEGEEIPAHWCRKEGERLYVFFPSPKSKHLTFPIDYGQSLDSTTSKVRVSLYYDGKSHPLELRFGPYQSLLFKIENGKVSPINIEFVPKTPIRKKRPEGFEPPWLMKSN